MADFIIRERFQATIDGILITNESIAYEIAYLLDYIEDIFGKTYNQEFIEHLIEVYNTVRYKYDEVSVEEITREFIKSIDEIDEPETLTDVTFKVYGDDWKFRWFNENLKSGQYND